METVLQTVKRLRKKYPVYTPEHPNAMTDAQLAEMMNEAAWTHRADGWGCLKDGGGAFGTRYDGVKIERDILFHKPTKIHYDVLIGAEEQAEPTFNAVGPMTLDRFIDPIVPQGSVEPVPVPTPTPTPVPVPQPPPVPSVTYGQFVQTEMPMLAAAYVEKHNTHPAPSDFAHLAWRRLVERWNLADMVKDI